MYITKSKCPKCENTDFEAVVESPEESNYKLLFIRCKQCKTVVGVMDYYNIGALLHKLAKKLKVNLDT